MWVLLAFDLFQLTPTFLSNLSQLPFLFIYLIYQCGDFAYFMTVFSIHSPGFILILYLFYYQCFLFSIFRFLNGRKFLSSFPIYTFIRRILAIPRYSGNSNFHKLSYKETTCSVSIF